MSATPPVRYERAGSVAEITFARPEARNALDTATKVALLEAVTKAADDAAVRAVVLAGEGRAFCVGQDLAEHARNLAAGAEEVWTTVRDHYNPVTFALATMAKPVVAAVGGVAAGAGAAFAFACDFRVLADTASFNLAFTAIGLSADSGASWTLPRLVGHARASELLMLSSTISAIDAQALGLATRMVPAADVLPTARELAEQLAAGATIALGAVKRALAYSGSHPLEESLLNEAELQTKAGTTSDHQRAVTAFLRKEKPSFEGR